MISGISIVNYGMGNIQSVRNAVDFLGFDCRVIDSGNDILNSRKLILPGVGSFFQAMRNIRAQRLFDPLEEAVLKKRLPILGICLGMQLLARVGEEGGATEGLGWVPVHVKRFSTENLSIKIPHIGFNTVFFEDNLKTLFKGLGDSADFYFVHSYRMVCDTDDDYVSGWTDYGGKFVASIEHDNIFGTQFHPEKSQSNGLAVLRNFCEFEG